MTQSIPTGKIDKSKKLFIASGVLAVLYAILPLIMYGSNYLDAIFNTYTDINTKVYAFSIFLEYISFLVFGTLCIVRRNNDTITTVLAVLPFLFLLISQVSYISEMQYWPYSDLFVELLILVEFLLLPLISLTSRKNPNTAKALWIVTLVLSIISLLLDLPLIATILRDLPYYLQNYWQHILVNLQYFISPAFVACFGKACIESSPVTEESKPLTLFDGYCDMTKHVLLLLFTFGIWQYIWIYRTTEYLNAAFDGQKRNPATKLLLCMFVPFYYIYWVYQSAKRIDALARQNGVASDISTVSTVLAVFIDFVPPILMQSKLNQICAGKGYPAYAASPAPQPAYQAAPQPSYQPQPQPNYQPQPSYQASAAPTPTAGGDTADELRKLKSLLDDGIITPEEFDAKKKQILGL